MTKYISSFEIDYDGARPNKRRALFDPASNSRGLLCIWLDEHLTCPPTDSLTGVILPFVWHFFSDEAQVLNYINSNLESSSTTAVLVASSTLGERVLPQIHYMDQLEAVIIYCTDMREYPQWTQSYSKVLNILNEPKQLQFELVHFLVKYYKHLGVFTDDRQVGQTYFSKAVDILRRYGNNDIETSQMIIELDTTYISGQHRKYSNRSVFTKF
jgi:hypothetical protein